MQTVAIKKNLNQYFFFNMNGLQCKLLQLRKILFSIFFVHERFAVQTVAIKKNLIQYVLYLNGLQCKPLRISQMLSIFRFCA